MEKWKDGHFETPDGFNFKNMNEMGAFYRKRMIDTAKDEKKRPLLTDADAEAFLLESVFNVQTAKTNEE